MLTHVVASRLLSVALLALAINVGAGNILAHNCIAVSAQNIVGAIVVGNKLEVLTHVVAGSTTSALAIFVVGVLGSAQNFFAGGANYIVSAVAIINNLLCANMVASVAADAGASLEDAGCDLVIGDLAVLIDSVNTVMGCIERNISGAGFLSTTSALAILVVAVLGSAQNFFAGGANYIVSAIAIINNILHANMVAGSVAANAGGLTVIVLVDVSLSVDHSIAVIADIRAGAIMVVHSVLINMLAISRKRRRSHSKHHNTCYNKRQHTAYFFKFHKPNLLYKNNTVYFSIKRGALLCHHAWTAGYVVSRNNINPSIPSGVENTTCTNMLYSIPSASDRFTEHFLRWNTTARAALDTL